MNILKRLLPILAVCSIPAGALPTPVTLTYTGAESAPTMLTGGFVLTPTFALGTALFTQPTTTIEVVGPVGSVPIPPSVILTLIGLACLGFYAAIREFAGA